MDRSWANTTGQTVSFSSPPRGVPTGNRRVTLVGVRRGAEKAAVHALQRATGCAEPMTTTRTSANAIVIEFASAPMAALASAAVEIELVTGEIVGVFPGSTGTELSTTQRQTPRSARMSTRPIAVAGKAAATPLVVGRMVRYTWFPALAQLVNWFAPHTRRPVDVVKPIPDPLRK
jgi:hypothetical protein